MIHTDDLEFELKDQQIKDLEAIVDRLTELLSVAEDVIIKQHGSKELEAALDEVKSIALYKLRRKDQRIKDLEAALDSIKKWVDWTYSRKFEQDVLNHGFSMIKSIVKNAIEGRFKVHSESRFSLIFFSVILRK